MIKRYKVPVGNEIGLPNPGYILMEGHTPDEAVAYVQMLGYLVNGFAEEFG